MWGGLATSRLDPENLAISYLPNVSCITSKRIDELLNRNDNRSGVIGSRNFNASNLSRTKMKKVEDFGFLRRPLHSIRKWINISLLDNFSCSFKPIFSWFFSSY